MPLQKLASHSKIMRSYADSVKVIQKRFDAVYRNMAKSFEGNFIVPISELNLSEQCKEIVKDLYSRAETKELDVRVLFFWQDSMP